jgi:hypothetical protein
MLQSNIFFSDFAKFLNRKLLFNPYFFEIRQLLLHSACFAVLSQ